MYMHGKRLVARNHDVLATRHHIHAWKRSSR